MNVLAYMAVTADATKHIEPYRYGDNFAVGIIDHPLFLANNIINESEVNRYITSVGMAYKLLPGLNLRYKVGIDNYDDSRTRIVHPETDEGQSAVNGSPYGFMVDNDINRMAITSNLSANYNTELSNDLDLAITVGQYLYSSNRNRNTIIGSQFEVENFYNLNNTLQLEQSNSDVRYRNAAVYGDVTLGYKNYLYLTLTGRNDWTSTLPKENRSYFFPSASLSWVVSDMTKLPDIVSFMKLRASYAIVGKDANAYAVGEYYGVASGFPFGETIGYTQSTSIGDVNLKPEFTNTIEIGTEMRFLNNRFGLDISYYNSKVEDMILGVPVSLTTGVSAFTTNAGSLTNNGIELLLFGNIVKRKNGLNWNVTVNWSKNEGKVESINTGADDNEIVVASVRNVTNKLVVGGKIGDLYGNPFQRNEDGRLILQEDGLPRMNWDTTVLMGNGLPDFIAGLTNDFSFRNLGLSFLWEWKKGGDVIDISRSYSMDNGQLDQTLGRYQRVIFDGVKTDGTENDIVAEITPAGFYRNSSIHRYAPEAFLQDASWVRLRSLSLYYKLPLEKLNINFLEEAKITLTGTNLFLDTPYNGWDPEANFFGASSNIYGYTGLRTPSTRTYMMKLNFTF
jgi:outer membrane receptor protein involved in Fe transport